MAPDWGSDSDCGDGESPSQAFRRVYLWRAGPGWIICADGEFHVLPDLEGHSTIQRAVLCPYANASAVTGPQYGGVALAADEAAASGVTYTYGATEGKRRLAAISRLYQPLISDLEEEIASADRAGDAAASRAAHAALRDVKRVMAADLRKEKDAQKTTLVLAVRAEAKRILRAIRAIEGAFPWIGAHLLSRLTRGFDVTYEPRPNDRIEWVGCAPPIAEDDA